jgi:hypothetical protein
VNKGIKTEGKREHKIIVEINMTLGLHYSSDAHHPFI